MARVESYASGALTQTVTNGTQAGEPASGVYDGAGIRLRNLTASEAAALAALDSIQVSTTNLAALQAKAQQALNTNATFQAIASPTNAQNATQVQALTKQCNGIIRLLLGLTDTTTGT